MLKVLLAISWVLAVGCLASCAPRSAVLLEDEVSSERRRRMDITVVDATTGETDELTLAEGRNAIEDHCRSQQDDTIGATVCGKETPLTADECQWDLCQAENWLCVAQTALLAARDPSGLVLNNASGNPAYEVQPQDAESQVALAHLAQVAVAKSMNGVASGMLTNRCDNAVDVTTIWNTSGDDPVGEASTAPFMEIFASTLAEGLRVGEAAADLGTERALAVAQRDASAVGDLGRAARMEWFDGSLSRVQAAQAQVGGTVWGTLASPSWTMDSGDYDDPVLTNVGIGVVPPCGQNCSRALSALRRSGVDFADLVPPLGSPYDFSATEAQLDPYIGAIAGNLNSRIAHDADTYAGAGAEEFAASIEVSLGDLLQAVEQMRYEDVVYARPRGVALAEPIRISPDAMGDQRFIDTWDPTTLNGPVPPPAMHYLTQARAEQLWIGAQSVGAGDRSLRLPIPRPERAYLFAMARAIASEALADPVMVSADDAEVPLQSILQQASARRALDVEVCGVSSSATRVRVFGLSAAPDPEEPEELVIVEGLDGLRCAVQGALAGQPCTGTMTYPLIAPADTWQFVQDTAGGDPRQSRLHAVQFDLPAIDEDTYVVRRRPGATEGYGAYEPIAGFSSAEVGKCITIPYDWTSYSNAARIFDFSDDARTSTRDCAGVPSRLPLEDEIIDDSDAFEDSWQHHLRIASAAATHADQLGQDLIASGLQIDEESERRVDAIQELCGTHINVDLFSEGQVHSTPCNESSTPTGCPGGYTCIGTACLSDSLLGSAESAQRAALEDCLGIGEGGAIVPVVALGSTPLCAWRSLEHPDQLCTGSSAPCPYVLPEGGTCTLPLGLGGTHEVVAITNGAPPPEVDDIGQVVGLVRSVGPGGEDLPGTVLPGATCTDEVLTAIDTLRGDSVDRGERLDALEIIRGRQFFDYDNIRLVAGRIGWVGEVGNYSHITVDGGPMRDDFGVVIGSTGSPITGPAGSWPCAGWSTVVNEERPLRPMGPTSGNYVDCTDVDARAHMNWRFGRAAVVLTAFTDLGLGNHRMPALPYGSTDARLDGLTSSLAVLHGDSYSVATSANFSGYDLSGGIYGIQDGASTSDELWRSANHVRARYHAENGVNGESDDLDGWHLWARTNTTRPIAFLDFGYEVAGGRPLAASIARRLWEGVGTAGGDSIFISSGFWDPVPLDDTDILETDNRARTAARGRLFRRALMRGDDEWHTVYLNHGRGWPDPGTHVQHLTHIFSNAPWSPGGHNVIHLFPTSDYSGMEPPEGYGPYITRRDLLDAMELACYVSTLQPPPPQMVTDEDRPDVRSAGDVNQVEFFAERVAQSFDAMARTQIVRDVPQDVVDRLTSENVGMSTSEGSSSTDRVTGAYGQLLNDLRTHLRTIGESPARIAGIIRTINAELEMLGRDELIFANTLKIQMLQQVVEVLHAVSACLSAAMSAIGGLETGARTGLAAGVCATQVIVAMLKIGIINLTTENIAAEYQNEVQQWGLRMSGLFDALDSERTNYLNAVDDAQAIAGQLRDARTGARASLAGALFLSSDAAGRQYATNTVMRRMYDINLQRYEDALAAAVRSGAIARFAIEQRFGVDLEAQQCTQLVDSPSTWANDICTATGVDYGALRDPEVEFDEDAIRRMFIGDYVRRLEQYVESYRFDYPYQSGDDLMVMSLRDDVVRASSSCVDEVNNLVGSSNDLLAAVLPLPDGMPGVDPGWQQRGCAGTAPYQNCMTISEVEGPRFAPPPASPAVQPARVFARSDAHPPRGFEVTFAPSSEFALGKTLDAHNLLPAPGSETWTPGSGTIVTTGVADPVGGTDAVTVEDTGANNSPARSDIVAYTSGHALWASCFIKREASPGNFVQLALEYDGTTYHAAVMRTDTGEIELRLGSLDSLAVIDLGDWWFVAIRSPGAAASSTRFGVFAALGFSASYPSANASATGSVTVYGARIADATVDPEAADPTLSTDYENGASYTQGLILPAGLYRLSWYERTTGIGATPRVDIRPASGTLASSGEMPIDGEPRALYDGWKRYYRVVQVPSSMASEPLFVGVFADEVTGTPEQALQVAGVQLEYVSGTAAEDVWPSGFTVDHGPTLFVSTTAPGYGYVDDCVLGDPTAFRGSWRYACAQLCSGGFSGHCNAGESPEQFCYWELPFSLDEDRLLSRGGDFGGGFAFGNYNYRSDEVAVNVVGTGVRNCGREGSSACYSTAGIQYSLIHTAPAASTIGGGSYSIRAHDGSLHPVDLFDGRIESARALAAERYLTNPLSSADASLLNDYSRRELRGRPMTGNYRLLIWDSSEIDFNAIEDVQVLWRYRYFTRTGSAYVCE